MLEASVFLPSWLPTPLFAVICDLQATIIIYVFYNYDQWHLPFFSPKPHIGKEEMLFIGTVCLFSVKQGQTVPLTAHYRFCYRFQLTSQVFSRTDNRWTRIKMPSENLFHSFTSQWAPWGTYIGLKKQRAQQCEDILRISVHLSGGGRSLPSLTRIANHQCT